MIGVLTQRNPRSSKKRWVACASVWRTRVTAAITLVRGRRCATSRRNSKRVRLGLDRVGVGIVDPADDVDRARLHFERLAFGGRRHDGAGRLDRAPGSEVQNLLFVVRQVLRRDHLHRMERGAVREMDEGEAALRVAPGANPALQQHGAVCRRASSEHVCAGSHDGDDMKERRWDGSRRNGFSA